LLKKYSLFLILVMLLSLFSGCKLLTKPDDNKNINNNNSQTEPIKNEPINPIIEQISGMTLDEKIGQMLMFSIEGYSLSDNTKKLIKDYKVGGFIVLGENVQDTKQVLELLNSIKRENILSKIPLFLSVDEEGGRVTRMPKEFKKLPTNKTIGKLNNKVFSSKIGSAIGSEIKAFGYNMDFAPVLDVNSNPNNPVIGNRSFGANASVVSDLGIETMKGIQSENIIAVVKHFPGHGDTNVDSHKGLPTVNNDLERLQSLELIPFTKAINNEVDAIMIAHILLPKIDKENPSSMSKIIITDILRNNLKFDGVVITDDMTMGAIMKNYNIGEAAVKSVNAGTDVVLVCHGYDNQIGVINALKDACLKGEILESRINESVYRILKLKKKYNLSDRIIDSVNVDELNNKINALLNNYLNKQ
jgi:beta-N-acetylhexosaminidase